MAKGKAVKFPFVSIEDGELVLDLRDGRKEKFAATQEGAELLNARLVELGTIVHISSSVDFPDEYGVPDIDFRSILEEGSE